MKLFSATSFNEWKLSPADRKVSNRAPRTIWTRKGAQAPSLKADEGVDSCETHYFAEGPEGEWYRLSSPVPNSEIKELVDKESK